MELLLVRHGESEADLYGVHEGRLDCPLTGRGVLQAAACGEFIAKNYPPRRIYASPLRRAWETAAAIADACGGVEVVAEPELMEHQNGLLAGLTFEDAAKRYPRLELSPWESAYGQESEEAFSIRGKRVLDRIAAHASGRDRIAIVCHGGVIDRLYQGFFGMRPGMNIASGDTAVHLLRTIEGDPDVSRGLVFANYTGHLSAFLGMSPREIKWGSGRYEQALKLRDAELRKPLGLSIYDDDLEREKEDRHYGFFSGGELVSYGCATIEGDSAHLRQIVTAPEWRGMGAGRCLMELMEKRLSVRGTSRVYLHARATAQGFYRKLGYTDRDERFVEVGIPHIAMYKTLSYPRWEIKNS